MQNTTITAYGFSAANKTVALFGLNAVDLARLRLIINVTRNVIYYNFADATIGVATVSGTTITFTATTVGHADTDALSIIYDLPINLPEGTKGGYDSGVSEVAATNDLLRAVVARLDCIAGALDNRYRPPDSLDNY